MFAVISSEIGLRSYREVPYAAADTNAVCRECEYYRCCFGGCPAIGFGESVKRGRQPALTDVDNRDCTFSPKGYSRKLDEAPAGCTDISPWPRGHRI